MPVQIRLPVTRAINADHTGWVEIIAVLSATVVKRRLGIQAAKWAARASPGHSARVVPPGIRIGLREANIHAAVSKAPRPHRYIAMASAGAEQAAISGADALTQATATPSRMASEVRIATS